MPERVRPREEFDRLGAANVSDTVLISLLLRTGVAGQNVVELAQAIHRHYGSLTAMAQASVEDLMGTFKGLGRVKAQILKASFELARRMMDEQVAEQPHITTPDRVAAVLRERARLLEQEIFWVLMLNTKNRMVRPPVDVTRGLLNSSQVHPREVFKEAIRSNCAAVVLAHNHPSGDPSPSSDDLKITRRLVEAGRIVDIQVLDHVIIGRSRGSAESDFISLREAGLVEF
ncbi:DNA repair protein RadC [Verrucomicrobiota bacterium]